MTDIVERLRLDADTLWPPPIDLLREAADEIEKLRKLSHDATVLRGVTSHDKDMLIASFKYDLKNATEEIGKLRLELDVEENNLLMAGRLLKKAENEIERYRMVLIDIRDSADWGNTTSGEGHARCREDAARALEG